jgi:hypothetical protein
MTNPVSLCILLPNSSELGRDIDPRETLIRLPVDRGTANIISLLYSGIGDDRSVSSED